MERNLALVEHDPSGWIAEWHGSIETEPNDGEFEVLMETWSGGDVDDVWVVVMVESAEPVMWRFQEENDNSFIDIYESLGDFNGAYPPARVRRYDMYVNEV